MVDSGNRGEARLSPVSRPAPAPSRRLPETRGPARRAPNRPPGKGAGKVLTGAPRLSRTLPALPGALPGPIPDDPRPCRRASNRRSNGPVPRDRKGCPNRPEAPRAGLPTVPGFGTEPEEGEHHRVGLPAARCSGRAFHPLAESPGSEGARTTAGVSRPLDPASGPAGRPEGGGVAADSRTTLEVRRRQGRPPVFVVGRRPRVREPGRAGRRSEAGVRRSRPPSGAAPPLPARLSSLPSAVGPHAREPASPARRAEAPTGPRRCRCCPGVGPRLVE